MHWLSHYKVIYLRQIFFKKKTGIRSITWPVSVLTFRCHFNETIKGPAYVGRIPSILSHHSNVTTFSNLSYQWFWRLVLARWQAHSSLLLARRITCQRDIFFMLLIFPPVGEGKKKAWVIQANELQIFMWNDLYKEEPPTYLAITCIRHSFENVLLIWKIIWLYNCDIQEVRAGGSIKEQLKAVLQGGWRGVGTG